MKHFLKKNIYILVGFILFYSSYSFSHEFEDKILANVNGSPITNHQVDEQIEFLSHQSSSEDFSSPEFKKDVLQQMINQKLQVQIAKAKGLTIAAKDLEEAMTKIAEKENLSLGEFEEKIKKSGLSIVEFKKQLESELLINELQEKEIAAHIQITQEDVKNYSKEKYYKKDIYDSNDKMPEDDLTENQIRELIFKQKFEEDLEKWLLEQRQDAYIKIYDSKLAS